MMWTLLRRSGVSTLTLTAALLTGCSSMNRTPSSSPVLLGDNSGPSRVTSSEAANVEVALGRTLERRGSTEEAIAAYKEAIKRDPHCAEACVRLAILYDLQGKTDESAKYYRMALKQKPGDADIFCNMGYSLYLQRRWAEAELNLRQAITLKPDHQRAHMNLGLVLARTDHLDEALVEFRTAKCSVADADVNVAFALTLDGKLKQAREYYQRAIAADPGSEPARSGLGEVQSLMARADTAPHHLTRTPIAAIPAAAIPEPENPIRLTSATEVVPSGAKIGFSAD